MGEYHECLWHLNGGNTRLQMCLLRPRSAAKMKRREARSEVCRAVREGGLQT